ncbi:hypothetical protein AB0G00_36960 [Nocardia salmonicida]
MSTYPVLSVRVPALMLWTSMRADAAACATSTTLTPADPGAISPNTTA